MKLTLQIGLLCWWTVLAVTDMSVFDHLSSGKNPELSKFHELVAKDDVLHLVLQVKTVTVFAPTNAAFRKADLKQPNLESKLASYHVVRLLIKQEIFPRAVTSELQQAAPLYLTWKETETGEKEYYVNNARIISGTEYRARDGPQMLYVIDEVLEPFIPQTSVPPEAHDFLKTPTIYNIQDSLGAFASSVNSERAGDVFRRAGNHTYFMPVGGDEQSSKRFADVDKWVIHGHVIPNHVLFTRTMGSAPYLSEARKPVMVELSLVNRTDPYGETYSLEVQSNTLKGDTKHRRGAVMSKIVRANIPVKNGVVHLIERPLMIIDTSIWKYIEKEKEGQFSEYYNLLNYASDVRTDLEGSQEKTVIIPTNKAIRRLTEEKLNEIKDNTTAVTSLLRLHMAMTSVTTDDVRQGTHESILSADNRRYLFFRVIGDDRNRTLTIEGGGVNATAVMSDIGATNGIIHIVDRLLGMPYLTVYEKMESDSDLSYMFSLGIHNDFNAQLSNTQRRFTYFVPSQKAWDKISRDLPSEYKQLTTKQFSYSAEKILQRHLIVGQELSSQKLRQLGKVDTMYGTLKIKESGGSDLVVEWEGIEARIHRPDVQAINGVIHVLDRVLMKRRDVTSGAASFFSVKSIAIAEFVSLAAAIVMHM